MLTAAWLVCSSTAWASTTAAAQTSSSGGMPFCSTSTPQSAAQSDRVLQFATLIRRALQQQGDSVALISRSGLQLQRFQVRYSHSGLLLQGAENSDWSVRQLYFDCEENRPRIFDQGLAGFLMSAETPDLAHVSVVFMPTEKAQALSTRARDAEVVKQLLAKHYSANAYPFSIRYQNCNQWVAELLATAWAPLATGANLRERAQSWLHDTGYQPAPIQIGSHWVKLLGSFLPLVHLDDHPPDAQLGLALQVSMPPDLEAHVRAQAPESQRLEFCHTTTHMVVREGWEPLDASCTPAAGDRVLAF